MIIRNQTRSSLKINPHPNGCQNFQQLLTRRAAIEPIGLDLYLQYIQINHISHFNRTESALITFLFSNYRCNFYLENRHLSILFGMQHLKQWIVMKMIYQFIINVHLFFHHPEQMFIEKEHVVVQQLFLLKYLNYQLHHLSMVVDLIFNDKIVFSFFLRMLDNQLM